MLSQLPKSENPALLSQEIPFADAAIYRLSESLALVQSVDFFTPVVDNPYRYGQIAAANSLSDLYAVAATPLTALNLVCFPVDCLEQDVLVQILCGGAERVHAAGAVVAGGHSIEDQEPKYGLSVTGQVDPRQMVTTCGANAGDQLFLTKPLGTGLLTTALKGDVLTEEDIDDAICGMVALNKEASEVMQRVGVSACTDITGFGLIGHAAEMAQASQVGLRIHLSRLPVYRHVLDMAEMGLVPAGSHRNRKYYQPRLQSSRPIEPVLMDLVCDPQTSGGLLIAVAADKADELVRQLQQQRVLARHLGEVLAAPAGRLILEA